MQGTLQASLSTVRRIGIGSSVRLGPEPGSPLVGFGFGLVTLPSRQSKTSSVQSSNPLHLRVVLQIALLITGTRTRATEGTTAGRTFFLRHSSKPWHLGMPSVFVMTLFSFSLNFASAIDGMQVKTSTKARPNVSGW